jgi:hypothetical protein
MSGERLGYSFNNGGLNNQKLALLGLVLKACEAGQPIIVPALGVKDLVAKTDVPVPFRAVYDIEAMRAFAEKYGIKLIEGDVRPLPVGGWDCMSFGAQCCGRAALHPDQPDHLTSATFDFFRALRPVPRLQAIVDHLAKTLFNEHDIMVAAQFRIETDWEFHSAVTLRPTINEPEDFFLTYEQIVAKIAKTLACPTGILVICDEAAVATPKAEIRQVCQSRFGMRLYWKSDFMAAEQIAALNPLERSIIDFELCLRAHNFVGLTRSTFSNLVTFQKFVQRQKRIITDYIYNTDSAWLNQRTDNGGHHNPRLAVI